ncbi:MAG: lipoate--protein ligase family protein [Nitrospirae bacterium]|nr:lipoate--protein ligase family protein [Nitrospirota bacterium]
MNKWRLIDSGNEDAYFNMALDEAIAVHVQDHNCPPTLRFYGWNKKSITIGAFQSINDLNIQYCNERNIPVVRRPTGGRAILHGNDLTYSFSSINSPPFFSEGLLQTYGFISRAFLLAFRSLGMEVQMKNRKEKGKVLTGSSLCFQSVSYGEITLQGRKLIGSAQKRWKKGFLQQGSLMLKLEADEMKRVFKRVKADQILSSMTSVLEHYPQISTDLLKKEITRAFEEVFSVRFIHDEPTRDELSLASRLVHEKYSSSEWLNYR